MLSLRELERAARALAARFGGARLERAVQREPFELELAFGGGAALPRGVLLLSCRPRTARVALREAPAPAPASPPPFAQYLRAHLGGARLAEARLRGGDRILSPALRRARRALRAAAPAARSAQQRVPPRRAGAAARSRCGRSRRRVATSRGARPGCRRRARRRRAGEDRFAALADEALLAGDRGALRERGGRGGGGGTAAAPGARAREAAQRPRQEGEARRRRPRRGRARAGASAASASC